jgi:hypothetical protein
MTTANGAPAGGCEPVFLPVLRFWSKYFARTAEQMEAVLAGPGHRGTEAATPPPTAGGGARAAVPAAPDAVALLRDLQTGQETLLARLAAIEARLAALETGRKRKPRG